MTNGRFISIPAKSVNEGDILVTTDDRGRASRNSMRVDELGDGTDGKINLRLGDDGLALDGFLPDAMLLIFRGGDMGDMRDKSEDPLLPVQEANLRAAGLGDVEIAGINARGGYRQACEDLAFMSSIQDMLDAYFAQRHVDVRNALRGFGWEGERGKTLTMSRDSGEAMRLVVDRVTPTPSRNIVAMSYVVAPASRFEMPGIGFFDDLSMSPLTVALQAHTMACDYIVFNEEGACVLEKFGHLIREKGQPEVTGADFAKAIQGVLGDATLSYPIRMALNLPVKFKVQKDSITSVFDTSNEAVFRVSPGGHLLDKGLSAAADDVETALVPAP